MTVDATTITQGTNSNADINTAKALTEEFNNNITKAKVISEKDSSAKDAIVEKEAKTSSKAAQNISGGNKNEDIFLPETIEEEPPAITDAKKAITDAKNAVIDAKIGLLNAEINVLEEEKSELIETNADILEKATQTKADLDARQAEVNEITANIENIKKGFEHLQAYLPAEQAIKRAQIEKQLEKEEDKLEIANAQLNLAQIMHDQASEAAEGVKAQIANINSKIADKVSQIMELSFQKKASHEEQYINEFFRVNNEIS